MPAPSLRPTGPVETAIVWKNVVALLRVSVAASVGLLVCGVDWGSAWAVRFRLNHPNAMTVLRGSRLTLFVMRPIWRAGNPELPTSPDANG